MADINSIQEEQNTESKTDSTSRLQTIFAPVMVALVNKAGLHPFIHKLKQNNIVFYSVLAGAGLLLILLLLLVVLWLMSSKSATSSPNTKARNSVNHTLSQAEIQQLITTPLPAVDDEAQDSSVDNLIIKGNELYNRGLHQEAYKVFDKIAQFSQSIASYNLGTIQLKSELYHDAITAYEESIKTGQNVSVSAINAAVAAFKINNADLYGHYVQTANDNLSEIINEPFYSYAYALVSYYGDEYFETLSPLLNPNSLEFNEQNHRLAAHIFTIFGDDSNALEHLQATANPEDDKSIGLLYARKAEYDQARTHLTQFLQDHPNDIESLMALQIINLKLGNYAVAASNLNSITSNKKLHELAKTTYPIKVIIKPELFDVSLAQKTFWGRDFENKNKIGYKMLFYFAPYRVFDAKRVLQEITQASSFAQLNIKEGKNVLLRSATTSKIDREIIRTLSALDTKDLRQALVFLNNATQSNPNDAILYYNLGLVYAQLGQYDEAYTRFIRAYYLDQTDYLSGIFAVLAGRFSHKDTERVVFDMSQSFYENQNATQDPTQRTFIKNFLNYLRNNRIQQSDWIAQAKLKEPIFYALEFAYALRNKNKQNMLTNINALKAIFPNDIVANILSVLIDNFGKSVQDISINMYNLFNSDSLDLRSLYYGGALPRELYVYTGFITGSLQNQARIIQNRLIAKNDDPRGTLQTLGLINIYHKDFQKAYAIFGTLIDELQENDSHTRFLAAVSAIGAGNYGDAALLLQLAKMETPSEYEARYALGLLYQAAKNYQAAAAKYSLISRANFQSEFFDFQIDTQKIYAYELESNNLQSNEE